MQKYMTKLQRTNTRASFRDDWLKTTLFWTTVSEATLTMAWMIGETGTMTRRTIQKMSSCINRVCGCGPTLMLIFLIRQSINSQSETG